ncbi:HBL/NHE enterotoxin family protein [Bacillus sp. FSL L8-0315]
MNKNLYKKIILSTIITGMAASNVIPLHTLAAEQTVSQQQESLKSYSLGPGEFKEVMGKMVANILTMDSYANTISNQQQTDLSKISSSINGDLQANMIKHQEDAKTDADFWFMYLKPRIMNTPQNIVSYNDTFQASYKLLLTAIEQKDTEKLKYELENLYNSILYNSQKSDVMLEKLKNFQGEVAENTRNFKEDFNQLENILGSKNARISILQQQIDYYNNIIKENSRPYGMELSIFMTASDRSKANEVTVAKQEIEKLKSRISGAEAEIVILTDTKNNTEHMTETIDTAITALENIKTQWNVIGAKYKSLLESVDNISPDLLALMLTADLDTAKDNWQDLKNYADKLYEGAKIVQGE